MANFRDLEPDGLSPYSPLDNAYWTGECDPEDGPTMLFGQGTDVDFAYDGDVIYHELGHGMVAHLTPAGLNQPAMRDDGYLRDARALNEGFADYFAIMVTDDPYLAEELDAAITAGEAVLIEGTQGFGLSLYHGDYPYVTSKDTTAAAACVDVGIGPTLVTDVIVVFKAYASRVGAGPMATELDAAEVAARGWQEFGAVTGRVRRIGEFDFGQAARACVTSCSNNCFASAGVLPIARTFVHVAWHGTIPRCPTTGMPSRAIASMIQGLAEQ